MPVAKAFSFIVFFLIATRISSTIAKALGDVYRRAFRTLIYAVLVFASSYYFSQYGLVAVASAIVVCKILDYVMAYLQVKSLTKASVVSFVTNHFIGIALVIIFILIDKLIKQWLVNYIENMFLSVFVSTCCLLIAYFCSVFIDHKKVLVEYKEKIFK